MLNLHHVKVKTGQDAKFHDAMATWKSCYLENEGTRNWSVWRRLQGEAGVHTVSFGLENWADLAKEDSAAKACSDILRDKVDPTIAEVTTSIARYNPMISNSTDIDYTVVTVVSFKVEDGRKFREVVRAVSDAQGDDAMPHYWYSVMGGGPETEDYFVFFAYKDFAAMDENRANPWQQYEKAHGEAAREALSEDFDDSISQAWNYTFSRIDELSHTRSQ